MLKVKMNKKIFENYLNLPRDKQWVAANILVTLKPMINWIS